MIVARGYITLTNIQGSANLLDWQSQWREGESPAGWSLNGVAAENSIVGRDNPFGVKSLMWKCTPNAVVTDNGGPAGGLVTPYFKLDDIHTYRYTAFVYREKASKGNIYHGCFEVNNLSGVANTNPYFFVNNTPAGQWYLLVGHIHPSKADNTWQLSASGIYDMTGKKITSGIDYKLQGSNVNVRLRNYLYYTDNPDDIAYFYNPRLEVLDGNEMSIEQLLQVSTRKEIDATKTDFYAEIQKLNKSISSKVSQTDYNTLGERVKKAETEILQTPETINLAVRKIAVGTRNYVSRSKYNVQENVSNVRGWGVRAWKLVDDIIYNKVLRVEADGAYVVFNRNDFKCGDYVTISLTIKGESDGSFSSQICDGNGGNRWGGGTFSYTKEWQRVSVTIKIPLGITVDSDQNFYYYPTFPILIADVTINKGNVAAAWQLSDEEQVNKDNILSSINLSEEGVKIDGKKVEITGELLAQIIKAKGLNVGNKTFIDAVGNFKTDNGTFTGKMNATSGSIGNFSITDGDLIGVDDSKKERIRVSTKPLPDVSNLFTGLSIIGRIDSFYTNELLTRNEATGWFRGTDFRVTQITLDGSTGLKITGGLASKNYKSNFVPDGWVEFRSVICVQTTSGVKLLDNISADEPFQINYNGTVEVKISTETSLLVRDLSVFDSPDHPNWEVYEPVEVPQINIFKQGTTEKTFLGADGLYSVFGSGEYIYFKRGVGFVCKGKTDMPGVLASGSVSSYGIQSNVWGAKSSNAGATKGGVGIFNVPHNIGHTKYTVTASSYNNGVTVAIVSKSPYSVQLQVGANGSFYDIGFDYTIIGQN